MVRKAVRLKEESIRDMLSRKTLKAVARHQQAGRVAASDHDLGMAAGVGGILRGHGEGLLVLTKVFPENYPTPQEGEMGDHPRCVQQGWDTIDLD